jgi:hypothetical protein
MRLTHATGPRRSVGRDGVRAYVQHSFDEEDEIQAWFAEPVVDGDRAAVAWWATLVELGREISLAGTSLLRFDAEGLVRSQWDTWNQTDGRFEPAPGWGSSEVDR